MNALVIIAPLLGGLGLFFVGVRSLPANLVPLIGHRARVIFSEALRGPLTSAGTGLLAGLLTQSATAVSWIVLGLVRAGVKPTLWVLAAPAWASVGTSLLPILVAVNLAVAASYVIGLVGFATYFKLDRSDRHRYVLNAGLGAALMLFGMHIVSDAVDPVRAMLAANGMLAMLMRQPLLLLSIGAALSVATQSSTVAAAFAVAGINNGLLTVPAALPLIAGANMAGMFNNALSLKGENASGRMVFMLLVVQKFGGSLLLVGLALFAAIEPARVAGWLGRTGQPPGGQIAAAYALAQFAGATVSSLSSRLVAAIMARLKPPAEEETLAQPVFLLREALNDPPAALDLAVRELARLAARIPLLLDPVREAASPGAVSTAALRLAGVTLAGAIKNYLLNLLDRHPGRNQVAAALLLENSAEHAAALHEALAELAAAVPQATRLPQAVRLVEALHLLMSFVADHAAQMGADDPTFVLKMLGDRNAMMTELRQRLSGDELSPEAQDALFRMTILFERAVWLARRLVMDLTQAQALLAG